MGAAAAKADGAATVARMKAMPTDDDCFGPGRIREDGRKLTPAYLFEVKQPAESKARVGPLQADRHDAGRRGVPAAVGQRVSDGEGIERSLSPRTSGRCIDRRAAVRWRDRRGRSRPRYAHLPSSCRRPRAGTRWQLPGSVPAARSSATRAPWHNRSTSPHARWWRYRRTDLEDGHGIGQGSRGLFDGREAPDLQAVEGAQEIVELYQSEPPATSTAADPTARGREAEAQGGLTRRRLPAGSANDSPGAQSAAR